MQQREQPQFELTCGYRIIQEMINYVILFYITPKSVTLMHLCCLMKDLVIFNWVEYKVIFGV